MIGFLARLSKVLQQHAEYSSIPRKLIVAKRLAQCLNPALPAGVHQKALDVYGAIFEFAGVSEGRHLKRHELIFCLLFFFFSTYYLKRTRSWQKIYHCGLLGYSLFYITRQPMLRYMFSCIKPALPFLLKTPSSQSSFHCMKNIIFHLALASALV